jgi:hypothetical protein
MKESSGRKKKEDDMLCDVALGAREQTTLISTTSASGGWSRQPSQGWKMDRHIHGSRKGAPEDQSLCPCCLITVSNTHTHKKWGGEAIFDRRATGKINKKLSLLLWDYWTTTTRIERKDRLLGILMTGSEWIQKWVVDLDSRKKSIENGWKTW